MKESSMHELMRELQRDRHLWDSFALRSSYDPPFKDRFDRVPASAVYAGELFEPRVSEFLKQRGFSVEWPDKKGFAVCLTHDVDILSYPIAQRLEEGLLRLREKHVEESMRVFFTLGLMKQNPVNNFERIMSLEESFGARSTYFFKSLHKGEQDYNYDIGTVAKIMRNIIRRGGEVALHGERLSPESLNQIRREKKEIENVTGSNVTGYRSHALQFNIPQTWRLLKTAGFEYDSTIAHADCIGFRNGMCYPFKPYDITADEELDIYEIPLVLMDGQLFDYMKLDFDNAWRLATELIRRSRNVNGVITICWHNHVLAQNGQFAFYTRLLQHLRDQGAWMTTGQQILNWWTRLSSE